MTTHKNIYEALAAAQGEFGKVTKGATNPAFKSKYASLADVASVVIPVMNTHGCAVLHYVVDGNAMRTEFVHGASETKVACDVPLIVDKNNMQGMKSATTYAKRIGLESLSGIAPEDDDGNAAASAPPRQKEEAPALITDAQLTELQMLFTHLGVPVAEFLKVAKIATLDKLPANWFDRAKKWVNDKAAEKRAASDDLADDAAFLKGE
jgi:hypothetical protein